MRCTYQIEVLQRNIRTWRIGRALKTGNRIGIYGPNHILEDEFLDFEERGVAIPCYAAEGCALRDRKWSPSQVSHREILEEDILDV